MSARADSPLRGHMPLLDGVRGLAILMVLLLHFVANTQPTNTAEKIVTRICEFGALGVDLFFVLSGFLITGILFDAKGSPHYFKNFYMRRALRIFPLYYGVLVFLFVVAPLIPPLRGAELDVLRQHQAWAWFYGVNFFAAIHGDFGLPYIDHFWSLAVEEHFYFFWPLVVWAGSRTMLVRVSLGLAITALAMRAGAAAMNVNHVALWVLTPFRLDALCLGGFLAVVARGPRGLAPLLRMVKPVAVAAALAILGSYAFNQLTAFLFEPLHQVRATLFAVLFGALIVTALTATEGALAARFFGGRVIRFFGKYSYGLYVWHHFISYYFTRRQTELVLAGWVGNHTAAVGIQATIGIGASVAIAVGSYHLFESRFLSLKRFWPSRGGSDNVATSRQDAA